MTKEEFIKNNRGINPEHELSADFLEVCSYRGRVAIVSGVFECFGAVLQGIYDRIVTNEIQLRDQDAQDESYVHPKGKFPSRPLRSSGW